MALKGPSWLCFLDWFGVVMCGSGSQGAPSRDPRPAPGGVALEKGALTDLSLLVGDQADALHSHLELGLALARGEGRTEHRGTTKSGAQRREEL